MRNYDNIVNIRCEICEIKLGCIVDAKTMLCSADCKDTQVCVNVGSYTKWSKCTSHANTS